MNFVFDPPLCGLGNSRVVIVSGYPGCGRTTVARELVRSTGLELREFGASDYNDEAMLRRTTHALGSRGGLMVQMGLLKGIGVIFDDLDTISATTRGKRVVRVALDLAKKVGDALFVVYVTTKIAEVPGLRKISRRSITSNVNLGRPTMSQVYALVRSSMCRMSDVDIHSVIATIPPSAKRDFRSLSAYVHTKVEGDKVCSGEGERDTTATSLDLSEESPIQLSRQTLDKDVLYRDRTIIATSAPRVIACTHSSNLARIIPDPRDRILHARSLAFAALCWSRSHIHDTIIYECAMRSGPLAAYAIRRKPVKLGKRSLVSSTLLKHQHRYNRQKNMATKSDNEHGGN